MHNLPSLPSSEVIAYLTNINCLFNKVEFQVRKGFRVQPKMALLTGLYPPKGKSSKAHSGKRLQDLTPLKPDPCNMSPAGGSWAPERLLPGKPHKATALSAAGSEPGTRIHEDS